MKSRTAAPVYLLLLMFMIMPSCSGKRQDQVSDEEYDRAREALVEANRILVRKDAERIRAYAERRGWKMQESESGLWYQIYEKGSGRSAQAGRTATLEYKLYLLNGTLCYDSDLTGPKKFLIGRGGVESGLEEGILLLREGDRARFIMPPHLAHGLTGDGNKIPPRAVIVYDVRLVSVE